MSSGVSHAVVSMLSAVVAMCSVLVWCPSVMQVRYEIVSVLSVI